MWLKLMDWLPDLKVGTFEIRDVASLLLAALGAYLAWLAIRMGRSQGDTAQRQADIAEVQHQIMQEQLAKRTDLRVMLDGMFLSYGSNFAPIENIRFNVHNGGNKSADGFYWEVLIPEDLQDVIKFINEEGNEVPSKASHHSDTEHYRKVDGHYAEKLFPYSGLEVARIQLNPEDDRFKEFAIWWRIRGEDGMIPPKGLAFIKLKRLPDDTFAWTQWHPGQKIDDIQDVQS